MSSPIESQADTRTSLRRWIWASVGASTAALVKRVATAFFLAGLRKLGRLKIGIEPRPARNGVVFSTAPKCSNGDVAR